MGTEQNTLTTLIILFVLIVVIPLVVKRMRE